ncbi:MAG: flagellar basal body L-ring protein FlgH [Alphaproteobacteria bacterium]
MAFLYSRLIVPLALAAAMSGLSACSTVDRLSQVGEVPVLTQIEDPTRLEGYRPVSIPMPETHTAERTPNSLWRTGARAFFKDQRAGRVGDLLTVLIDIEDGAKFNNKTRRSRKNSESANADKLLGLESKLSKILPDAVDPTNLVDAGSESSSEGDGEIDRTEELELTVAALITQSLPNGNLVIVGRQEIRVNYEVRELQVAGIIRPEDISSTNSIRFEQIAEARISYGGRGHISDVQQPRYGQQVYDILFPF